MPEIGMPRNEFIDDIREKKVQERSCSLMPGQIEEIAKRNDVEVIGSGAECVVVPGKNINNKETVTAYTYSDMNPLRMKEVFYAQRIFSTLFPHNFPHFYAAFGKNSDSVVNSRERDNISGTIRERVVKSEEGKKILFPINRVEETCNEIGLPFIIDWTSGNIIVGEDGGEYYVDTISQLDLKNIDQEKLFSYIEERSMSETDIHIVQMSIHRLEEIGREREIQIVQAQEKRGERLRNPPVKDLAIKKRMDELIAKLNSIPSSSGLMSTEEEDKSREV
ncbi:MAG: hypothetical protein K9M11_04240 [Candidatus Pacebacteria bacterium]|nr:hypothetical protein [Candidatus Paceibacterota bacterium]